MFREIEKQYVLYKNNFPSKRFATQASKRRGDARYYILLTIYRILLFCSACIIWDVLLKITLHGWLVILGTSAKKLKLVCMNIKIICWYNLTICLAYTSFLISLMKTLADSPSKSNWLTPCRGRSHPDSSFKFLNQHPHLIGLFISVRKTYGYNLPNTQKWDLLGKKGIKSRTRCVMSNFAQHACNFSLILLEKLLFRIHVEGLGGFMKNQTSQNRELMKLDMLKTIVGNLFERLATSAVDN